MSNSFRNVLLAELLKLRTLPAVASTLAATMLGAAALAWAFAAPVQGLAAILQTVAYTQIGFVLLGVLTAASEYSGGQNRTTLTSIPNRHLLLAGKTVAYTVTSVLAAMAMLLVILITARMKLGRTFVIAAAEPASDTLRPLVGALVYPVLAGMLAYAVAILLRHLIASLVAMLTLVLIVSPYLQTVTRAARYLPDAAGRQLLQVGPIATDEITPLGGSAIMIAWVALALAAGVIGFRARDA